MSRNFEEILLYRITHIDNLDYILNLGKLTCPNHPEHDTNYIGIGDDSLIRKRKSKSIELDPFGNFNDYISFYFGARSPMLYNICNGFGVEKRNQKDIIYLVSSYKEIKSSLRPFVYFDGHGFHSLSECYNDDTGLDKLDWSTIYSRDWADTLEDPDRKRRKQAELLVYWDFPLTETLKIGVYNQNALEKIRLKLAENQVNLISKIKNDWYY